MKRAFLAVAFAGAASAVLAIPTIVENSVSIDLPVEGLASRISYTLTGGPAIVTVDIETNTQADASGDWVNVGGRETGFLAGAANRVVYDCDKPVCAYWWPQRTWSDASIHAGCLRASVKAWPLDNPPDYMVVSLQKAGVSTNLPNFYASAESLPGGLLENKDYRTTKLVMRRIPAAGVIWRMGAPAEELSQMGVGGATYDAPYDVAELQHRVRLSKDYYMAVFEMTQKQYMLFKNWNPSKNQGASDWDVRPVENMDIAVLRGRTWTNASNHQYCWPEDGHAVAPGKASAFGMLRDLTGIEFDLPTDAQWEYACRAGTGGAFANGATTVDDVCKIGWFAWHMPEADGVAAPVGNKEPNAWGLYDMHGNVSELVLDNNALSGKEAYVKTFAPDWETGGVTDDPVGPKTDEGPSDPKSAIIRRGGSCLHSWYQGRSAAKSCGSSTWTTSYIGFRVVCPIEGVAK